MRDNEGKTSLRGQEIVSKCDPRIELRGQIDSLLAQAVLNCAYAEHYGYTNVTLGAKDIVRVVRELMRAEATGEKPEIKTILGMSFDELRDVSNNPREELGVQHYMPDENTDLMSAHLNVLRTDIRRTERTAWCLEDDSPQMEALRLVLNRLSSAAYILMLECRSERP